MNQPLPPPTIPPTIPPEKLAELVRAMERMRDDLLKVSFLLRDHLEELDSAGRDQARQAAQTLIRQSRSQPTP